MAEGDDPPSSHDAIIQHAHGIARNFLKSKGYEQSLKAFDREQTSGLDKELLHSLAQDSSILHGQKQNGASKKHDTLLEALLEDCGLVIERPQTTPSRPSRIIIQKPNISIPFNEVNHDSCSASNTSSLLVPIRSPLPTSKSSSRKSSKNRPSTTSTTKKLKKLNKSTSSKAESVRSSASLRSRPKTTPGGTTGSDFGVSRKQQQQQPMTKTTHKAFKLSRDRTPYDYKQQQPRTQTVGGGGSSPSKSVLFRHLKSVPSTNKLGHGHHHHHHHHGVHHVHHHHHHNLLTNHGKAKSSESWIPPDVRSRMLQRDLAVAKQNYHEMDTYRASTLREAKRCRVDELERSRSKERYGIETRRACGLCGLSFLPVNLVMAIPLKAVLDIRDSWVNHGFDPEGLEDVRVNPNSRRAPACYNQTRVCAFCAQLFDRQQNRYRPSWEAKEEERARLREAEEVRRRKIIDDPLAQLEKERVEKVGSWQKRLTKSGGSDDDGNVP